MKTQDLKFEYPAALVATEPKNPPRVLLNEALKLSKEILFSELFNLFQSGDVLVINETKVLSSRVIDDEGREFLFVRKLDSLKWEVLFPAKAYKVGAKFQLPGDVTLTLDKKGLPQTVSVSKELDFKYFDTFGEANLPPYILEQRDGQRTHVSDKNWYQTKWAEKVGSVAAPTASLHFSLEDLSRLKSNGVHVVPLTLHVGLGTFLPVKVDDLKDHKMHFETVEIPCSTWDAVESAKSKGKKVWALGTTVARSLESVPLGKLEKSDKESSYLGETDIFIYPPYKFQVVDGLLTNFHQPESTLLAMVCAFYGTNEVLSAYRYAIKQNFRLFSYGDLSIWIR